MADARPRRTPEARVSASQSASLARLETLAEQNALRLDEIASTAREGRDGVIDIKATMREQNFGARIQAVADAIKLESASLRSDFVNALSRSETKWLDGDATLRKDVDENERRIKSLEGIYDRSSGRSGVVTWLWEKGTTILIGAITAGAMVMGLHLAKH